MDLPDNPWINRGFAVCRRGFQGVSVKHKRIIVSHYGGPEELKVVEEECPEPKKG
jgi:hypothetical protein